MFLGYIHSFRALAIFFIIAGHSIDVFNWSNNTTVELLLRILLSNGSILFVFIAGYLFQHLSGKYSIRRYFKSKFTNVLVPYFLISIPAIIVFITFIEREGVPPGFYNNPLLLQVISFYLTGKHLAPLWFIPMISLFYAISPLLIKADRSQYFYFLLPLFIILSCFFPRASMPIENFLHFFSIYMLGMFCSHFKLKINNILKNNKVIFFILIIISLLTYIEFYYFQTRMTYVNYFQKILMSIFFLGIFIKFGEKIVSAKVSTIANVSFGIFFIHSYILTAGKLIFQHFYSAPPNGTIGIYLLITFMALILCTYTVLGIKIITKNKSKYYIGS